MSGIMFRPELCRLVERGVKTMTRRPVRIGARKREVGHVYAVQPGRGKRARCHVLVTEVRREKLGDITDADAIREGFTSREAFFAYWRDLYPETATRPHLRELLERIAVAEATGQAFAGAWLHPGLSRRALYLRLAALEQLGLAQLDDETPGAWTVTEKGADVIDSAEYDLALHGHLDRDVYVIAFELERNSARLLAPAARPSGNSTDRVKKPDVDGDDPTDHGYTTGTDVLRAGEHVDPSILHPDWRTDAEARRDKLQRRALHERIVAARAEAAHYGIDIRRQERRVEAAVDALERKVQAQTTGRAA